MNRTILSLFIAIFLFLQFNTNTLSAVQRSPGSYGHGGIASRRLAAFDVQGVSMLDALLQLGRQARIALGIEYLHPRDLDEKVSLHLTQVSVGQVVEAILQTHKGYTWKVEGGVVHIGHAAQTAAGHSLLDVSLQHFAIPAKTALSTAANLMLPAQLQRQLQPPSPTSRVTGIAGSALGGRVENQVEPLDLHNVTVRQVLDRLVSEKSNAAWVILAPPGRMDRIPKGGLWYVIEYDAPQEEWGDFIRGLLRENWTPQP